MGDDWRLWEIMRGHERSWELASPSEPSSSSRGNYHEAITFGTLSFVLRLGAMAIRSNQKQSKAITFGALIFVLRLAGEPCSVEGSGVSSGCAGPGATCSLNGEPGNASSWPAHTASPFGCRSLTWSQYSPHTPTEKETLCVSTSWPLACRRPG